MVHVACANENWYMTILATETMRIVGQYEHLDDMNAMSPNYVARVLLSFSAICICINCIWYNYDECGL